MKYLVDGKAPGQFRARCRKTEPRLINDLDAETYTSLPEDVYTWWNRKLGGEAVFIQCAFETSDRAAFVEHMAAHGKKPVKGAHESWSRGIRKMWRGPRLLEDGKPWVDPGKKTPLTQTCARCGLVAEVDDRPGNVLWWDEHERGCRVLAEVS